MFHVLRTINYRGCERVVRINGLDSPYWKEDIRCAVAGGCDSIRIPKTESAKDVYIVEKEVIQAEKDFGRPEGSVLIMAAIESARGVMRALDICEASERLFGIALSGGDYTKDLQTHITGTGLELMGARQNLVIAARAATFLITVPAMLPVYKKLKIRPTTFLLICVTSMGVINLLPGGDPTMRAAIVLGIEPNQLWLQILPMKVVGIIIALATAVFWGIVEKKRGAGAVTDVEITAGGNVEEQTEAREYARPKLFWFNLILTLAVIVCLIFVKVPSHYVFMLGCAIALLVNFRGASLQNKIIKSHAGPAIMMSSAILCAGVFLGVMEKTGIMNNMATVLAGFVPMSMGRFLPLIIGILAVPLTLMFDTDSFFFGLMPVLIEIAGNFGVLPAHIAIVMVVCRNCATFISPVVPATFLDIGLADVEIKDHIKNCFFWI